MRLQSLSTRPKSRLPRRLALLAAVLNCMFAAPSGAVDVGTSTPFRQQQFEAWGTSLAWWANGVGGWLDTDAKADLIGLMFDPANGLGLNYARYNIGGGQNRLLASNFRPGALVPGWVPNAPSNIEDTTTWQWDWNADPRQRSVLDDAIALGVDRVDAISYSPPHWMTISQDTSGGPGGGDNLLQTHFDEYAHYQTEVVKHFYENLGVRFQAFSPKNEPSASWWAAGGGQEGMHVAAGFDQRLLIETVGQAMQAKGVPVGIAAAEEFASSWTVSAYNQFNSYTKSFLTQINTHVYGGSGSNPSSSMTQVRQLADADNLRLYQSEYGNNSTTGLLGGIGLANRITQDVNVMGVDGWAYWQVVEPTSLSGAGWGLAWAGYDQTDSAFTIRKQYHVMRQFASYIRPGSHILSTPDADTVAAYDPVTETTVLVVTNDGTSPLNKIYDLLDGPPAFSRLLRTSDSEDYASLGGAALAGSQLTVNAPGPSVSTVVLHGRPNLIHNANFDFAGEPSGTQTLAGGWQASGDAAFYESIGHNGGGGAALHTDGNGNSGSISQVGIGEVSTDLTGVAYQFSLDVEFPNFFSGYDSETHIALRFYGADGTSLTHAGELEFATLVEPTVADNQWRTFRTPIVMAPAGTKFVRPVVRFENAGTSSNDWVHLDNAYLQQVNYRPRGRKWLPGGTSVFEDASNWDYDASTAENSVVYFGDVTSQPANIVITDDVELTGLTFDSPNIYRLTGTGQLTLSPGAMPSAMIDVRQGDQILQSSTSLMGDATIQVLANASITLAGDVNFGGHVLSKQGPGDVLFSGGLNLDGGTLQIYAIESASIALGGSSVLDGTLEVLWEPGADASLGQAFELMTYLGTVVEFTSVNLPSLPTGLDWQLDYGASSLTASIVQMGLPGDFNNDGVVTLADYTVWRDHLGGTAALPNDPTPGLVDTTDYHVWKDNFSMFTAAANVAQLSPIPEPNAVRLSCICFIAMAVAGARRNRLAVRAAHDS